MEISGTERSARNEVFFREVNERIDEVAASLGDDDHRYEYVCECSDPTCTERIELTRSEYERVRRDGVRHVLARGHEIGAADHPAPELQPRLA